MAVCNAADGAFVDGGAVFYENFLLDMAVHCLQTAMKSINNDFIHLNGQRKFRFIYTPSVLSLMKALNALRRAFDIKEELTSINMMNEKMGSVIGSLIQERRGLLDKVDVPLMAMCQTEGKGYSSPDDLKGYCISNDSHEMMNCLQTKLTVTQVLFDVYKVLSIELHRRDVTSFFTCCPTCTDSYIMKEEYQSMTNSIRECLPMQNVLVDLENDPLHVERIPLGLVMFMESQVK